MISVSELREALVWSPDRDQELSSLRSYLISLWESVTFRPWMQEVDRVEEHDNSVPRDFIFLKLMPVSSITSVEERPLDDPTWTLLTATEYALTGGSKLYRLSGLTTCPEKKFKHFVRVTYSGGYTDSTAPQDIKQVFVFQARYMLARMTDEHIGLRSITVNESGSTSFLGSGLHPEFARLAKMYQRRV